MRCVIEARRRIILSIAAAVWICPAVSWPQTTHSTSRRAEANAFTLRLAQGERTRALEASGQVFPTKPVRYVVPFGPGTSPDLVARLLTAGHGVALGLPGKDAGDKEQRERG